MLNSAIEISFCPTDRVLIVAPHPDDEAIATGGLIQNALSVGAKVSICFLSSGENNAWAQRLFERRIFIGVEDQKRWAEFRKNELLSSLKILGLDFSSCFSLSYRDQGVTEALMNNETDNIDRFVKVLQDFAPSHLVIPSPLDLHPDHNAFYFLLKRALIRKSFLPPSQLLMYLVHPASFDHNGEPNFVRLSADAQKRKHDAIFSHKSQCVFWRGRMLRYINSQEYFHGEAFLSAWLKVRNFTKNLDILPGSVMLEIGLNPFFLLSGLFRLWILSVNDYNVFSVPLWPFTYSNGRILVKLPTISKDDKIFCKLENRLILYDLCGWQLVR